MSGMFAYSHSPPIQNELALFSVIFIYLFAFRAEKRETSPSGDREECQRELHSKEFPAVALLEMISIVVLFSSMGRWRRL